MSGWGLGAWGLGGYGSAALPSSPTAAPAVLSWCSRGLSWLLAQFRGLPRLAAVLCALLDQVQALDQTLADADQLRALETAVGAQLDDVGEALGFPRDVGLADSAYRVTLRAVAAARGTDGRLNRLIRVMQILMQGTGTFTVTEYSPASVRFESSVPLSYSDGGRFARVLRLGVPAGVDFALIYAPAGLPIITFDDDVVHPPVPYAEDGVPDSGGVYLEEDPGR